jgi:competence protein ComEC
MTGRDSILIFAVVAYGAGAFASSPLVVAVATALVLTILRVRGVVSRATTFVAAAVFLVSVVRVELAWARASRAYARAIVATTPPAPCELRGVVAASPTFRDESDRLVLEVVNGACAGRPLEAGDRVVALGAAPGLGRGDIVDARVELAPIQLFANDELTSRLAGVSRDGVAASGKLRRVAVLSRSGGLGARIDAARAHVRTRIEATYHPEAAPLARALVLGETDLDPAVDEAFRTTGLSHLLAVSGTHLVVAVLSIAAALRALLLRIPALAGRWSADAVASAVAIPLAWAYADFAGAAGSVLRAAVMLTAVLGARVLERAPSASRSLGLAIAAGVALDPLALLDVSFTLSTAATVGLLVLSRPLGRVLGAETPDEAGLVRRGWSHLASAMGATLAATFACAPTILTLSPTLPAAGLVANLVAAPLGELFALPVCLLHAALSFSPGLELGAARVGSGALLGVLGVARVAAAIPVRLALPPPTAAQLGTVVVACAAIFTTARLRAKATLGVIAALAVVALEVGVRNAARPTGRLRVSALDVGQGDALLVDLPDGAAMLVDAGGVPASSLDTGKRVVLPVLRARRRDRLAVVVLSHPHPDHFGGLASTLDEIEVGEIWDTGESERDGGGGALRELLAKARAQGTPILGPRELCAAPRDVGGARIEVLSPCPDLEEGWSTNDGSFVLRVTLGGRSALLVGDAEKEAERHLLATERGRLGADLLKVGHHGSRTSSSPEFVAAVAPSHAVISCGVRNRFGHPARETLATLAAAGASIARTDRGGEWQWWTDGEAVGTSR